MALRPGKRVRVNLRLTFIGAPAGVLPLDTRLMDNRRNLVNGVILSSVKGYGGVVWFVRHLDTGNVLEVAAYHTMELVEEENPSSATLRNWNRDTVRQHRAEESRALREAEARDSQEEDTLRRRQLADRWKELEEGGNKRFLDL